MQLDERLKIDTPEQIALEVSLAGIGSRFLAVAVDTLLQVTMAVAGLWIITTSAVSIGSFFQGFSSIGLPTLIILMFCVYWGYFALFEAFFGGLTPGKGLVGIRVIKESGRPINAYEAIARNVVRAVDFLPAFYGIGVIVMMIDSKSRRLGDFVAGTVVVHDRNRGRGMPSNIFDGGAGGASASPASASVAAHVSADELVLIESYLRRRFDLDPLVRDQMAEQIAVRIAQKTGAGPAPGQPIDEFLETIARSVRDTARFR